MKVTKTKLLLCAALALSWTGSSLAAQAASINYGDFTGTTLMYLDVTETANSPGDEEPLFGAPSIAGNQLDFDPKGFSAVAECGGSDLTDGQLNFTLMGIGGSAITSITIREGGDYTLFGSGSAATQIGYGLAIASIVALEVDGMALGAPIVLAGANAQGGANLAGSPGIAVPWFLALSYDVNAALIAAGVDFSIGATKLEIALDNTLVAISEGTSVASIAKKDFRIDAVTVVPEPTTAALVCMGLLGLAIRGRSR